MTKEEIINTLRKLGIRTETKLELIGTLGLELEPNGNKIDFSYMMKGFKTPKMSNLIKLSTRRSSICQTLTI